MEVEPGRRGLAEQHARAAVGGIDAEHIEALLVAALALDEQGVAVGRPIDPREIDVRIGAEIDLDPARAVRSHDVEVDPRIGRAGRRIALLVAARALGADRGPGDDVDRFLVDPGDGEVAVAGRPPMAGAAVHLLLGDELGRAPADCPSAVLGQPALVSPFGVDHVEILVADEGKIAAGARNLGVEFGLGSRGDATDVAVEAREIKVAVERDEDRAAVGRPIVADDSAHAREPRALAPHPFLFGYLAPAADAGAVDQHPRLAGARIDRPQIVAVAIVGPVAQHGREPPVGRELEQARRRARQRGAGEDAFEGELLGLGRNCGGEEGGGEGKENAHGTS